jgi:hypothetical protein
MMSRLLPEHYDPINLIDMVHWARVMREVYTLAGNREGAERTYIMAARVRHAREREVEAHKLGLLEGSNAAAHQDEECYPYR